MNHRVKTVLRVTGVVLAVFLMWYFSTITGYVIAAIVLSMIVSPMTEYLSAMKIKRFIFPRWLATLITLTLFLAVLGGILFLVAPIISREAKSIYQIDPEQLSYYSNDIWNYIRNFIHQQGWIKDMNNIETEMMSKLKSWINISSVGSAFSSLFSFITSFVMAVFSIFFLSFFFLKDKQLLKEILLSIFPKQSQHKITNVFSKIRLLLSRYFLGLLIQISIVMLLIFLGLTIFDIPNALLIAFIAGLLNVIPYIGPAIGTVLGVVLAVVSTLSTGVYSGIEWVIFEVLAIFAAVNVLDISVNQPLIFSKSVNAHPVEIFIVTLIGGHLGGIGGMVIAIPTYTVVRIVLKEYLSEFAFIDNLTKNI